MKLATSVTRNEYDLEPMFEVMFYDLSDAQFERAFDLIEAQLRKIYVPLPVCGGDSCREDGYAWAMFDGFTVSLDQDRTLRARFPLTPEGEDQLDPTHDHWVEPRDTMWIEALPFAATFGRALAAV